MILFYDAVRKITVSSCLGAMVFKVCSGGTVGPQGPFNTPSRSKPLPFSHWQENECFQRLYGKL